MKFVLLVTMLAGFSPAYSQLKVNSYGNTLLQSPGTTGGNMERQAKLEVRKSKNDNYNSYSYGVSSFSEAMTGIWNYGVVGSVGNTLAPSNSGRAFGVFGTAGYHTSGYNYGVMGNLTGTTNGAAVYGVLGGVVAGLPGRYAGYFAGNVVVTGTINGTTVGNSDIRLKENIAALDAKRTLDNVMKMNPIEYNLKQAYTELQTDSGLVKQKFFDETSMVYQKKQYGLSAQELQQIYPDLVYEQDNGYLAINYTGLIPLLIESVKELKEELDLVKEQNALLQRKSKTGKSSKEKK